jgi:hypothetical protein
MQKKNLLVSFCLFIFTSHVFALGQVRYVENACREGCFPIIEKNAVANLYVDTNDFAGVGRAANDLQADIARDTCLTPALSHKEVILGKMQSSSARLVRAGLLTD